MGKLEKLMLNVDKAKLKLVQFISQQQQNCKHDHIAEFDSCPPVRICCDCGMREVGWGPGYTTLVLRGKTLLSYASDSYMTKYSRGLYINNEDKGPIIRRETSIKDLILNWERENTPTSRIEEE